MADPISIAFRGMRAGDIEDIDTTVKTMILEYQKKGLLDTHAYRQLRMKLLGGQYRSQREKQVLVRLVSEIKKMLVA